MAPIDFTLDERSKTAAPRPLIALVDRFAPPHCSLRSPLSGCALTFPLKADARLFF
jgi:hypothetical protein